jgi:hypothetical protein
MRSSLWGLLGSTILILTPTIAKADDTLDKSIRYLISSWQSDKSLSEFVPPQVLPIAEGSRIYGGCGENIGGMELGGSAYCQATHTIYLVPQELGAFVEAFGPSAQAYVVAHEFGHAIQAAFSVELTGPARELQADCLAGIMIGSGSTALGITRDQIVAMASAAYAIGSDSHGTGAQRSYALLSGMGVFDASCKESDMKLLAAGRVTDPAFLKLSKTRSGDSSVDTSKTPFPKTAGSALGI